MQPSERKVTPSIGSKSSSARHRRHITTLRRSLPAARHQPHLLLESRRKGGANAGVGVLRRGRAARG
eukprot:CAMPEP_0177778312 /NCGR_PEP_ID=MMETSP0491_2-20121128/15879_1 /TAXON_ID=63592 /ORGANISM="Tetraselmis chuii, Strain PLY429" /LENGTH=66 /DNA_ID=CAMNT_0019297561 /DNA_START=262 /DNA_END=462 /DNA_ORIENTATION=-